MNKVTAGKAAWDIIKDSPDLDHSAHEQGVKQLEDYEDNVIACTKEGMKHYDGDFYIVVLTKKEPILKNIIRNYFIHRSTCPTPNFEQTVYKYHRSCDEYEHLWVLPNKETYMMFLENPLEVDRSARQLLSYIIDDADGTLLRKCKKLNGEIK